MMWFLLFFEKVEQPFCVLKMERTCFKKARESYELANFSKLIFHMNSARKTGDMTVNIYITVGKII